MYLQGRWCSPVPGHYDSLVGINSQNTSQSGVKAVVPDERAATTLRGAEGPVKVEVDSHRLQPLHKALHVLPIAKEETALLARATGAGEACAKVWAEGGGAARSSVGAASRCSLSLFTHEADTAVNP